MLFDPQIDLLEAMESCLTIIKALPFLLDMVYDIKEWITPHSEELHAHTQPKSFKFVRDEQGHCVMYYRNYSHMRWEGPQRLIKVRIVFSCSMCIVRKNPYFYEPKGNKKKCLQFFGSGRKKCKACFREKEYG